MKYKLLGRSGLKVSELCLGTMGFGTEAGWGADKATSFAIMEAFANAGGNFLDTANVYKLGTSEKIIGEFVSQHDRDFFVIATKYSLKDNTTNPNASGNNRKNMMRSVEQSHASASAVIPVASAARNAIITARLWVNVRNI